MVTAPETSRTLPGICGTWAVRMPYVNQVAQASAVSPHEAGETPVRVGRRSVRRICGTTMVTPRVAPR